MYSFKLAQYKKIISFKQQQPKLKVTVAIGGWNEGSGKYSNMSATKVSKNFYQSLNMQQSKMFLTFIIVPII